MTGTFSMENLLGENSNLIRRKTTSGTSAIGTLNLPGATIHRTQTNNFYISGSFTSITNADSSVTAASYMAKWNGTKWVALPGNPLVNFADPYAGFTVKVPAITGIEESATGKILVYGAFNRLNGSTVCAGALYYNGASWSTMGAVLTDANTYPYYIVRGGTMSPDGTAHMLARWSTVPFTNIGFTWNGTKTVWPTIINENISSPVSMTLSSDGLWVVGTRQGGFVNNLGIHRLSGTTWTVMYEYQESGGIGTSSARVFPHFKGHPTNFYYTTGLSAYFWNGTTLQKQGVLPNLNAFAGRTPHYLVGEELRCGAWVRIDNAAPVANSTSISLAEDSASAPFTPATDVNGDALSYTITSPPTHGTVTGGANMRYIPSPNYFGSDSFTYTVSDGVLTSNTGTITVTVTPVNDPLVYSPSTIELLCPVGENTSIPNQLINGPGDTDTITYYVIGVPSKCTVTVNQASGVYTITPKLDATGTEVLQLPAQEGSPNFYRADLTVVCTFAPRPIPTISPNGGFSNATTIPYTITFSVDVSGFDSGDIQVTNGTKGAFTTVSPTTYTIAVTPNGDGDVTVSIPFGACSSAAYGVVSAATSSTVVSDRTAPTATIEPNGLASNAASINFTLTMSETATVLTSGNLNIQNGALSLFSRFGNAYSFTITPTADGPVNVALLSNTCFDAAGNGNVASTATITSDKTRPLPVLTAAGTKFSTTPFAIDVVFPEAVSGMAPSDFTVTGGSIAGLSGSGANYSLQITPANEGTIEVALANGASVDAAGNLSQAGSATYTYDNTTPTLSITPNGTFTNVNPITATFSFSEPVLGFTASDITLANGTKGTFSGGGAAYTLQIIPTSEGVISLSVPAGACTDGAGNPIANQSATVTYDVTSPTVAMLPSGTTQAGTPVTATFTFSEPVLGFTSSDVQISNGSIGVMSGSGASYSAPITPFSDGTVTMALSANVCTDRAGNPIGATNVTWTSDRTGPSLIVTPNGGSTNASPIAFTFTFSEPVTGFVDADITLSNGSKGVLTGSGSVYTLPVTPIAEGTVAVSVAGAACADAVGNQNTAGSASVNYSSSNPTLIITPNSTSFNSASATITFIFSAAVTGFTAGDITVTNATKGTFSGSGSTYTLVITPTAQGAVTVSVPDAAAVDLATNPSLAASSILTYDTAKPDLTITPNAIALADSSIAFTFTFTEPVTGFTSGDVVVTNGSKGLFTGSGATYTLLVSPSSDGAVTVTVNADTVMDLAGNTNTSAAAFVTSDRTRPAVTVTPNATSTSASPITFTLVFSEVVTGLNQSAIQVSNGTKGSFTGSGTTYFLEVTPGNDGIVSLTMPANAAADAVGNGNLGTTASVTSDRTGPVIDITPSAASTNAGPISFTMIFSEVVTGFTSSDVTTNGTKGSFSGSGTTYTIQITPSSEGPVTCSVGAGLAVDVSGNGNQAGSGQASYDITNPTINIFPSGSAINASTVVFTFTFSEPVSGFTNSDVNVAGATKNAFTGAGGVYSLTVTPISDGTITISVGDGACNDLAGNSLIGSSSTAIIDRAPPTLVITPNGTTTNAGSFQATFTFSEPVTGFVLGDIAVTNGTPTGLSGNGTVFTANIAPTAEAAVVVSVGSSACFDQVGLPNAGASAIVTSDLTRPAAIISPNTGATRNSPIIFTISFQETVTGLQNTDFISSNGSVGTLSGSGSVYTIAVTPGSDGPVVLTLGANSCVDLAGNLNTASTATVLSDRTPPTVTATPNSGSTNASPMSFVYTFSEPVDELNLSNFNSTNAIKINISGSGTVWTLTVSPITDGLVAVQLLSNAAYDDAGNAAPTTSTSQTYDSSAPFPILSSANPSNATQVAVTVTFNEPVTGLASNDFTAVNATIGALTGSGANYTLQVNPIADGPAEIFLAAGAAIDAAGNVSLATDHTFVSDRNPPTVAISPNGGSSNAPQISFAINFSEDVTGFSQSDITVTNGSKGAFSGSNGNYTLEVFPAADGLVTVSIANGACTDLAGNANIQTSASIISDRTAPTPTISPNGTQTNISPIIYAITFPETVTGLTVDDFTATNGALGQLTGSGLSYSVAVTPTAQGAVILQLASGAVVDQVGNQNAAATSTVTYDATAPTLVISPNGTVTTANPITFTFVFSESVTDFTVGDISVTNGSKGAFSGSGSVYTLLVSPHIDGTVTATVGVSACTDLAGNGNQLASASVTSDRSAPVATWAPASGGINSNPINFALTFSEPVTGLDASDFLLSNGVLGTLSGTGLSYTVPVTPSSEGAVTITLKASSVADQVGNPNLATTATVTYDVTVPTVSITPNSATTNASPITFTFTFSESVTGFTSTDVTVSNGTAGAFSGSGAAYTLAVAPLLDGNVTVSIPAFSVSDIAGNTNAAAAGSVVSDRTGPAGTITPSSGTFPTSPITFTITFNESVTGFTLSDLNSTNATLSGFSGSGTAFTVNATPTVEGQVTLNLPANVLADAQGNLNSARSATVSYDLPSDPVLYLQGGTITYQRGDPAIILDPALAVSDPDNPSSFDTGTIALAITTNGDANDQLTLVTDDYNGWRVYLVGGTLRTRQVISPGNYGPEVIMGTWAGGNNGNPFTVTFNREATPARVNSALRALALSANNTIGDHNTINKTLTITFTDGTPSTNPTIGTMQVSVISPNRSPQALNGLINGLEDAAVTGSLSTLWIDSDSPSTAITYEAVGAATNGTITSLNPVTGEYVFTPTANFNGTATFSFRVHDESSSSDAAILTVNVAAVNDAPSFTPGSNVIVNEDSGAYSGTGWATAIVAGPTNEQTQTLAFVPVADVPALFSVQPTLTSAGYLTFTPALNANGTTTVSISATDDGGTANGGANQYTGTPFTITITPINDPPEASPIIVNTVVGGAWSGQITISDPDGTVTVGGGFTYALTGISRLGDLVIDTLTGAISFSPTTSGSEVVSYSVTDGTATITSTISIWVSANADARPQITSIPGTEVIDSGSSWTYSLTVKPTSVASSGVLSGSVSGIAGAAIAKNTGNTFTVTIPSLLVANGANQVLTIIISDDVNHQADTQILILVVVPVPSSAN